MSDSLESGMVDSQVFPVMDASLLCRAEGSGASGALSPYSSSDSCSSKAADALLSLHHKSTQSLINKICGIIDPAAFEPHGNKVSKPTDHARDDCLAPFALQHLNPELNGQHGGDSLHWSQ